MFYFVYQGTGSNFQSQTNPKPVVQVGASGSSGSVEITDMLFSTRGPTPGAIVVEWNVKGTSPASAGMWDSHIRIGSGTKTSTFKYGPIAKTRLFFSFQPRVRIWDPLNVQHKAKPAKPTALVHSWVSTWLLPAQLILRECGCGMVNHFFRKQCYNKTLIFFL